MIPLALLEEPWLQGRRIVVLEPRRLATRAAARRMAYLLNESVGETVGYRTRDERRVSGRTVVEVVTEGILTRRLQQDPELPGVALVVFDEIHERNLTTDLGLALTLDARRTMCPDLRLLAMSATVDAGRTAALLADGSGTPAPAISAGGAPHPVHTHWFPRGHRDRIEPAVVNALQAALRREPGDALVFLPGAGEITRTIRLLEEAGLPRQGIDLRPLYGNLSAEEQDLALQPSLTGRRRVVVATDIAESSLTVEGVRIVVDGGQRRAPYFDTRTGLTRLRTVAISKASAEQRAGRAGREGPGVVYRLWSKGEHAAKRAYDEPEIRQVELAGFALELAVWGTPTSELSFMDPPPDRTMAEAHELLRSLGALDDDLRPTALGKRMNQLPLHPRVARMVILAGERGPSELALAAYLGALLDERDVLRGRPDDRPGDLATRLWLLVDRSMTHPEADFRAIHAARRRAADIAARVGGPSDLADLIDHRTIERCGAVLALAYPDRIAVARQTAGRFQLPSGTAAWVPRQDPLADVGVVVIADLDGNRKEARIRLGAPLDPDDLRDLFGDSLDERRVVEWDRGRDELVERVEQRLAGVVLDSFTRKPAASDAVMHLLLERVQEQGTRSLTWTDTARSLAERATFLHRVLGEPWPDWSEERLLATLEEWLGPFLLFAQSKADLQAVDVAAALGARFDHQLRRELDRLTPERYTLASGRSVPLSYETDAPVLAVKVQEMFGVSETPTVAGGAVKVVLHLLSPAGRPVQITSDLAGFWSGSWKEVRKEMAGRYPKHKWPEHPERLT